MNHLSGPRRAFGRGTRRIVPAFVPAFIILAAAVAYAATTFLVVSPTNLQG